MNDDINSALAQHYPQPGRREPDEPRTGDVT
jgi:hypothetical protein